MGERYGKFTMAAKADERTKTDRRTGRFEEALCLCRVCLRFQWNVFPNGGRHPLIQENEFFLHEDNQLPPCELSY